MRGSTPRTTLYGPLGSLRGFIPLTYTYTYTLGEGSQHGRQVRDMTLNCLELIAGFASTGGMLLLVSGHYTAVLGGADAAAATAGGGSASDRVRLLRAAAGGGGGGGSTAYGLWLWEALPENSKLSQVRPATATLPGAYSHRRNGRPPPILPHFLRAPPNSARPCPHCSPRLCLLCWPRALPHRRHVPHLHTLSRSVALAGPLRHGGILPLDYAGVV